MIDTEMKVKIKQLFHVEKWKVGTISSELAIHPDTVKKALEEENSDTEIKKKPTLLDGYQQFIKSTLEKHPKLTATRIHQMIEARGYQGSIYPVRRMVAKIRPKVMRAYQDLHFFPGEVGQVDWGDFGWFEVAPKRKRKLNLFVIVLAYSRRIYATFFFDQKLGSLLEGHANAFNYFGGNPRVIMYDNMKTAVIKNMGKGIQFNEGLLELSGHYHFSPRACNPRSGWEKGRVERAIRYIRDSFAIESRDFNSIEELNEQLSDWLMTISDQRPWPDDRNRKVIDLFKEEILLQMAGNDFPYSSRIEVKVNKKSMIQFDCNLYTVPPTYVGKLLRVEATSTEVKIYFDDQEVASHKRNWSKQVKVTNSDHIDAIIEVSRAKSTRQSKHLIVRSLEQGEELIKSWSTIGESLARQSRLISDLIKSYDHKQVDQAVKEALSLGTPRAESIAYLLKKDKTSPPKIKVNYKNKEINEFEVERHDISTYDYLEENTCQKT